MILGFGVLPRKKRGGLLPATFFFLRPSGSRMYPAHQKKQDINRCQILQERSGEKRAMRKKYLQTALAFLRPISYNVSVSLCLERREPASWIKIEYLPSGPAVQAPGNGCPAARPPKSPLPEANAFKPASVLRPANKPKPGSASKRRGCPARPKPRSPCW